MSQITKIEIRPTLNETNTTPIPLKATSWIGRWAFLLSVLALAIGARAAVYGNYWWNIGRYLEITDDARVVGQVTVIAPKVSGYIAQVAIADGQAVHAGDLLLKLDDRDYRAALNKADTALATSQKALSNLASSRKLQEAVVAKAQAKILAADTDIVRARDEEKRYRQFPGVSAMSPRHLRSSEAEYGDAVESSDKAREALVLAKRELDVIDTQKRPAEAALAGAIAERETATLNLGYTELRAPFDGMTGDRRAGVGTYITAGSQLISLIPKNGIWVNANFTKSQIAHIHVGSPATIEAEALPGQVLHGHVLSIAPASGTGLSVPPENMAGNFAKISRRISVRIGLDVGDATMDSLWPGLSTHVTVNTHSEAEHLQ